MIKEIREAIRQGKIVALEENRRTGKVSIQVFDDSSSLQLAHHAGADTPEKLESASEVLFITDLYEPTPIYQI